MKLPLLNCLGLLCIILASACSTGTPENSPSLKEQLHSITDNAPGMVGIAFVTDGDTLTINNGVRYPMMSVFKLHQSLAVADALQRAGSSIDTILNISATELDRNTWSPMLTTYGERDFSISAARLIDYALTSSDNNASNLLFSHIVSPAATSSFIKSVAPDTTFNISYSEAEMKQAHELSYINYTSPLAASLLIRRVFDSEIVGRPALDSIRSSLTKVTTGQDRLGAPLPPSDKVLFAHKTGSGYRNPAGELTAHNDVGYFRFPDGRSYSLAVLIRDFNGTEQEASAIMADISRCVYDCFNRKYPPAND